MAAQPLVLARYDLAPRLADLLDLPLVSEEVAGLVESSPARRPVPAMMCAVLPSTFMAPRARRSSGHPVSANALPKLCAFGPQPASFDAGVPLRDVQEAALAGQPRQDIAGWWARC